MKVVHVVHHYAPCTGGVERVVEDIGRELSQEGIHNKVVALNRCAYSTEKLPQREFRKGIEVVRIPFLDLKYYKIAPSVLGEIRGADVIHVHGIGFFADYLALMRFHHRIPIVVSTHGGIFHTNTGKGFKEWYFRHVTKWALSRASAVLAVSQNDAKVFSTIAPKTQLMENGVHVEQFWNTGGEKEPNTFLHAGRLSRNKQLGKLLDTFGIVKENGGKFRLWIVGEDWEKIGDELQEIAQQNGILSEVTFTGKVKEEQLKGYLSRAEFLVSASRFEGFGLSVVEGMAASCIPVVNDIDAFRLLVEDRENGFRVDFNNPRNAANEILRILSLWKEEKRTMAENARKSSMRYSWEGKGKKLVSIYEGLARK